MDEIDYRILKHLSIAGEIRYSNLKSRHLPQFESKEIQKSLNHLGRDGFVSKHGWGRPYEITEKGERILE